jgi:hypothetical protein
MYTYIHTHSLDPRLAESTAPRFRALNAAVAQLLDEFSLVSSCPFHTPHPRSLQDPPPPPSRRPTPNPPPPTPCDVRCFTVQTGAGSP